MTKSLQVLSDETQKAWAEFALNFEAFASDIFEQLASMSDSELSKAGVSVSKTDISDKSSNINSIIFSFSHGETTYTIEKRRLNLGALWPNETIIACCYPKGGNGFRLEKFKSLVCSETVQKGKTYSTKRHFNESFRFKNEKNGKEALVVRVSPLHYINGDANEFSFVLKGKEEKDGSNVLKSPLPDDEFYGWTTYSSFPVAHGIVWAVLEEMRTGWSFALKNLGAIPNPYQRKKTS